MRKPIKKSTRFLRTKTTKRRNPGNNLAEKIMIWDSIGEKISHIKNDLDEFYLNFAFNTKDIMLLNNINSKLSHIWATVQSLE